MVAFQLNPKSMENAERTQKQPKNQVPDTGTRGGRHPSKVFLDGTR